ncbi:MAG: hypothetical protein PSX42_15805, partial [bacterium]|nr:hypothetical protein [bacterium]
SQYLKKDKFKINQIHNYIKKISKRKIRTGNIYYQTEIEIKIPFPIFSRYYGISSERDLIFEFTRKLAPNNYRKLKLKRVIGSKQIIIDYEKDNLLPPIFVDEIEIEKFFSNFFDRLALKISEPYKILSKELRKHYYEIKDQRYIAEYYLKLNGLTFIDDRSIVMCSRYIIYKYYPTIESTQQTGWLIYDEGPSEDYPEDIISSSNN